MNGENNQNMRDKINNAILSLIKWLELLLAIFVIIAVVISLKDILKFISQIYMVKGMDFYELFNGFLAHVLLLVIGLELTETLLRHTPGSIIDVMLFAIARKMLIHSSNAYELLVGAIAIAALFATKRFLVVKPQN